MGPGQRPKRLLKLARRVPVEEIRAWVQTGRDSHSRFFILRHNGTELLRSWHWAHGLMEITIEDDAAATAVTEHLKGLKLVFDSIDAAMAYGREHGLLKKQEE